MQNQQIANSFALVVCWKMERNLQEVMRLLVVLSLLSVCSSSPIDSEVQVQSFYNDISEDSYSFGYDVEAINTLIDLIIIDHN